jgi:hypothetical protein
MRRALLAASVTLAMLSCTRASDDGGTRAEPSRDPAPKGVPAASQAKKPTGPQPYVVIESGGREHRVAVEVVRTEADIRRGLMYRSFMAADAGMLFLFKKEKFQSFWMKNTLIPLDIIFISAKMTIAGIVESAEPRTTTSRKVPAPSQFVLEVNGGWTKKNGVRAGDRVRFVDAGKIPPPVPLGQTPSP